mgnify:CR=1 FL=1
MHVPDLDVSENVMDDAFNVDAHMTVLKTNQELINTLYNCKSSDSITSEEKVVKATTGTKPNLRILSDRRFLTKKHLVQHFDHLYLFWDQSAQ